MNYIGLTGRNMPAMAHAAEVLLAGITQRGLSVAVLLYIEDARQAVAVKQQHEAAAIGEIWRIGMDMSRPGLDCLVDAFIHDVYTPAAFDRALQRQLERFASRITSPVPAIQSAIPLPL